MKKEEYEYLLFLLNKLEINCELTDTQFQDFEDSIGYLFRYLRNLLKEKQ